MNADMKPEGHWKKDLRCEGIPEEYQGQYSGTLSHPCIGGGRRVEVHFEFNADDKSRGTLSVKNHTGSIQICFTNSQIVLTDGKTEFRGSLNSDGAITGEVFLSGKGGGEFQLTPKTETEISVVTEEQAQSECSTIEPTVVANKQSEPPACSPSPKAMKKVEEGQKAISKSKPVSNVSRGTNAKSLDDSKANGGSTTKRIEASCKGATGSVPIPRHPKATRESKRGRKSKPATDTLEVSPTFLSQE